MPVLDCYFYPWKQVAKKLCSYCVFKIIQIPNINPKMLWLHYFLLLSVIVAVTCQKVHFNGFKRSELCMGRLIDFNPFCSFPFLCTSDFVVLKTFLTLLFYVNWPAGVCVFIIKETVSRCFPAIFNKAGIKLRLSAIAHTRNALRTSIERYQVKYWKEVER